jgi:hypothetical protein
MAVGHFSFPRKRDFRFRPETRGIVAFAGMTAMSFGQSSSLSYVLMAAVPSRRSSGQSCPQSPKDISNLSKPRGIESRGRRRLDQKSYESNLLTFGVTPASAK